MPAPLLGRWGNDPNIARMSHIVAGRPLHTALLLVSREVLRVIGVSRGINFS